jgi:diguanylate cyclase (GGDEF)-like protein
MFFGLTLATVLVVDHLRAGAHSVHQSELMSRQRLESANHNLLLLRSALDHIHVGVLMLDRDLRLDYINRAMRAVGNVPEEIIARRPTLQDLLQFACGTGVFAVPPEERERYIADRVAQVRAGDPTPAELRLGDGGIAWAQCAPLPDGGRLMVYTIVTDLVRQNEELSAFRACFDQSDVGLVLLDKDLRARYINRAYRALWKMSDEFAESRPYFVQMMKRSAKSGIIDLPTDLDSYLEQRVQDVRSGDPAPLDLKLNNGEALRFRCSRLPDGGRVLTYTGVGDLVHSVERMEELATTDSLTGLSNRRHFLDLASAEWDRTLRYERPLSILMMDIDHFKSINDGHGHAVGDHVIADVADVCREQKRSSDIVARIGGEEFIVLLPETDLASAVIVAERLRQQIAARDVDLGTRIVRVTVSIGVAELQPGMTSIHELIKLADRALYVAKRTGRNRVCGPADLADRTSTAA